MTDACLAAGDYAGAWMQRRLPGPAEIRGGVWAVPMPLTGHAIRYSVAYLIEASGGRLVLVDAGYGSAACWQALTSALGSLGAGIGDIEGVLLTHNHPDHTGLARRVRETGGAWIGLHRLDGGGAEQIMSYAAQSDAALALAGAPDEVRTLSAETLAQYAVASQAPDADLLLEDETRVRVGSLAVDVVWTPGHTAGHCCFRPVGADYVLTGDHLLPEGLTQLGNTDSPASDPLGDVLESLDRLAALGVPLGLPGHQYAVLDLAARAEAVRSGFTERMDAVLAVVAGASELTGWEITAALIGAARWRRMGGMGRRFSAMETMGVLHRLVRLGRLVSRPGPPERFVLV